MTHDPAIVDKLIPLYGGPGAAALLDVLAAQGLVVVEQELWETALAVVAQAGELTSAARRHGILAAEPDR